MQFRNKPLEIEAIQFTGNNCFEILHFINRSEAIIAAELNQTDFPTIPTPSGDLNATPGDWVIKSLGKFYVCNPVIFEVFFGVVHEKL